MGRLMPCFVFSDHEEEQWRFYDVLHQRWIMDEERNGKMSLTWLQDTFSCEALYMGWLLLIDNDHHLSLLHPATGHRLPLPQASRRMPILQDFIFRFASPPPDCIVVAIHKSDGFFLVCRPGVDRHWSSRHRFPVEQDVFDAVLCNDKIYAASKSYVIAIDAASLSSSSTPDITCFPLEYLHANSSIQRNNLVESDGQLYMVWQSTLHPHECGVCRWAFSSHVWETATSIGNRLFMIGHEYSGSLPAAPDDSTTGMVYFLSYDNEVCSFNVNCRSLTTHYHCLYFNDEDCLNWLLIDEDPGDVQIDKHNLLTAYNNVVIGSNPTGARRGADVVTWSPKTPWLMFAKGYDATFKFIDPSSNSNTIYDLYIPELLNKALCHATDDGWLVVVGDSTMFLFNPFTRVRIDIIPPDDVHNLVHSKYALSSSPTCQGCLLFSIHSYMILLFRLSNSNNHEGFRAVRAVYYNRDPPTTWPLSNPVYYNGLFYCLDMSGDLGTYDPLTNTWVVIDAPIPFDRPTTPVESCFLIKSDSGDLISVFMDRLHHLIGAYKLASVSHHRWREVLDMGDKTLFVGPKACFIATAAKPEMANMICTSKFVGDCGNQLLWHRVGEDLSTYNGPFTRRDRHMQLWFVVKGVGLGYDRATGKNVVPSPFISPAH